MTSKRSFFNKGIFNNTVKRYWPAWALYAFALLLAMPIELLSGMSYATNVPVEFVTHINKVSGEVSAIMAFVSAIIVTMGVFSFMYKPRENSMVSALPVRREAVFGSAFLAGLLPLTAINLIVALLSLLTAAGHINGECVNAIAIWFGSYTLEFIAFYGIACCVAMLTGSIIALPILYGIFNFLAPAIEAMIRMLVDMFVYGLSFGGDPVTECLSPVMQMVDNTDVTYTNWIQYMNDTTGTVCPHMIFEGWGIIAIYAAVGVALAVCALLLYRRRKMECTGDVIAVPALKPVFKYGVAFCAAISFGLLIFLIFSEVSNGSAFGVGNLIGMIVSMAVGGAVGYFGADMLLKKSAHVFKGNWGGFFAVAAFCAILCLVCRFDVFGVGRYVPDAEGIKSVRLGGSYTEVLLTDEDAIKDVISLHESIAENLNEIAKEAGSFADFCNGATFDEEMFCNVYIAYTLENGRTVRREYTMSEKRPEIKQYVELMQSERILNARCELYGGFTAENVCGSSISYALANGDWFGCDLTNEQVIDLYKNGIEPDIKAGNISFAYFTATDYVVDPPTVWIEFADTENQNEALELYVQVSTECTNTIAWFKDNLGADLGNPITEPIVNEALMESTEYVF